MKTRQMVAIASVLLLGGVTGCYNNGNKLWPMTGQMTLVPLDYTCNFNDPERLIGQARQFNDSDSAFTHTFELGASCRLPEIELPEEWGATGSNPGTFGFISYWRTPVERIGPINEWFVPPEAGFSVTVPAPPPGCSRGVGGEQTIEMFIAGAPPPDFDYIEVRADGDCAVANFRVEGEYP